jgi:acyl-CoA synthetase (AMP-forming)/AMP-acid ligase II
MTAVTPSTLRQLVSRSDDHPAFVVPGSGATLSYSALQRALDRAAGRLAALGVRDGDRIGLFAANGPALVVAFLAITARGAAAAPLNPALGTAEVTAELVDLRVSGLLHSASRSSRRTA